MMRLILILTFTLTLACNSKQSVQHINIPRDAAIIYAIQIHYEISLEQPSFQRDSLRLAFKQQVLDSFQLTDSIWEQILIEYNQNPDLYKALTDSIMLKFPPQDSLN